jgi:sigma-B regulation protein RsbU (phosphoserine phosphatase)
MNLSLALRHDVANAGVGFVLLGLGLAAAAVAFARRRMRDPTLLYFAIFTTLYALRLLCELDATKLLYAPPQPAWNKLVQILSYVMPVAAGLFFEKLTAPGRRRWVRLFWQAQAALALVAIPWEIVSSRVGVLVGPYRILVLAGVTVVLVTVFRREREPTSDLPLLRASFLVFIGFALYENLRGLGPIPRGWHVEHFGFLVFACGLGTVAARRVFGDQARLTEIRQELATARAIQESILPGEAPRIDGLDLAFRYLPAAEVAGDFFEFLPGEGRRLGILVADVSGHGVPAALVASMLKVAVAAQAAHVASPGRVLSEINAIFHGKLKNQFITALYVYLDLEAGSLTAASAGHPPPLVWRHGSGQIEELPPGGLVLGRLRRAAYPEVTVPLAPGDRILLFTDGIPEALSPGAPGGQMFGEERLRGVLAGHAAQSAEATAGAIVAQVAAWTGRTAAFDDDLTLVVAGIVG